MTDKEMFEKMHTLKIGDELRSENEFRIIKVYNGWIVIVCRLDCNTMTSVFVPELIGGQF